MRFRAKVFLAVASTVMLVSLVEAGLDVAAARTHARLEAATERRLERYADDLVASIELRGVVPVRAGFEGIEAPRRRKAAYRILQDDRVLHGERGPFPQDGAGWTTTERGLVAGYRLEATLGPTPLERFVGNDLLVDVVDLPIFLALAFGLSWLLARSIVRPVLDLTVASEQLARQQAPEPIAVPSGDDELSRMARSFNAMSASIQGYLERERSFTRYASHELRTPLAVLRTQIDRARLGLAPAEEVLPVLERGARRMEGIIDALLSLARSSERDSDPTPLRPLVHELIRTLPPEAAARVTVEDEAAGEGTAEAIRVTDARLVQQALQNLVENAVRYAPGPILVDVGARDERVVLRVRDEGPGLPPDVLEGRRRPFDRRGGPGGGLGLGLSLVERIAEALEGRLELRNAEDGLVATLDLPVRVPTAGDARRGVGPRNAARRRHDDAAKHAPEPSGRSDPA